MDDHVGVIRSELVDMHPTVASLAGVPFTQPMPLGTGPALPRFDQAFGTDLSPLFDQPYDERRSLSHSESADPSVTGELMLKNASWSQWPSCGIPGKDLLHPWPALICDPQHYVYAEVMEKLTQP